MTAVSCLASSRIYYSSSSSSSILISSWRYIISFFIFASIRSNSSQSLSSSDINFSSSSSLFYQGGALSERSERSSHRLESSSFIFCLTRSLAGLLLWGSFFHSFQFWGFWGLGSFGNSYFETSLPSMTRTPKSFFLDHCLRAFLAASQFSDLSGFESFQLVGGRISGCY